MIEVEVFTSPGCAKCAKAKTVLRELAEEVGAGRIRWREVNILEELDHAVALGVLFRPGHRGGRRAGVHGAAQARTVAGPPAAPAGGGGMMPVSVLASLLGLLAFFEPCTLALHALYMERAGRGGWKSVMRAAGTVWMARLLLAILPLLMLVLLAPPLVPTPLQAAAALVAMGLTLPASTT